MQDSGAQAKTLETTQHPTLLYLTLEKCFMLHTHTQKRHTNARKIKTRLYRILYDGISTFRELKNEYEIQI